MKLNWYGANNTSFKVPKNHNILKIAEVVIKNYLLIVAVTQVPFINNINFKINNNNKIIKKILIALNIQ